MKDEHKRDLEEIRRRMEQKRKEAGISEPSGPPDFSNGPISEGLFYFEVSIDHENDAVKLRASKEVLEYLIRNMTYLASDASTDGLNFMYDKVGGLSDNSNVSRFYIERVVNPPVIRTKG